MVYRWEFQRREVKLETQVDGPLMLGDVGLMVGAALYGSGLAYVFEDMVAEHVAAGRLVPGALKAFIEFARAA